MTAKRIASRDLNHDNWNEDEESEDAGEFQKANEDILSKRVRKVAKRRIAGDSGSSEGTANPFSGFGGFQKSSLPAASSSSPFSFLSKLPTTNSKTNGDAAKGNETAFKMTPTTAKNDTNGTNSDYYGKVKSLNEAFIKWIKSNFDESKGLCDLTPVFKDYEKYMRECQELKDKKSPDSLSAKKDQSSIFSAQKEASPAKPAESKTFSFGTGLNSTSTATSPSFSFGLQKTSTGIDSKAPPTFGSIPAIPASTAAASFTFGLPKPATTSIFPNQTSPSKPAGSDNKSFSFGTSLTGSASGNLASAPSFSFGLQKTSTGIAAPVFGGSSTPFTFSNVTPSVTSGTADTANEEETEEPPKNEFVPVVEEDSLFSKRCKVYVKTGNDFADRGVGTLYLKKVDDKVQLIVRADTNLGNILLNIIICEGLPTSRMGKNNVMVVCMPMPESKPPPVPVLLRVKTGEEADELLAILEKHKKA